MHYLKWFRLGMLVVCLAIVVGLIQSLLQFHRRSTASLAPRAMTEEEARSRLRTAEAAWQEVQERLAAEDFLGADTLLARDVHEAADAIAQAFPDAPIAPGGLRAADWIAEIEAAYAARIESLCLDLLQRLESGDVNPTLAAGFFDLHRQPSFANALELRQGPIEQARVRAAPRWVRLIIRSNSPYPALLDFLESTFRAAFPEDAGYKLVAGPALTDEEQRATFKTLVVTANLDYAHFRSGRLSSLSGGDWSPPPVPILLECTFAMSGNPQTRSSWDGLEGRHAYLNPPTAISKKHIDRILENYRSVLISEIEPKFKDLPPFFIYPPEGQEPTGE